MTNSPSDAQERIYVDDAFIANVWLQPGPNTVAYIRADLRPPAAAGDGEVIEIASRAYDPKAWNFIDNAPEDHPALEMTRANCLANMKRALEAIAAPSLPPADWQMVPKEPTEQMWSGLARDLVMWNRSTRPTGKMLYFDLRMKGRDIPAWLEKEIPDVDHVPPKGTVAVCIFSAMLSAAPPSTQARER